MGEDFFLNKMKGVKPIKKQETVTKKINQNKKKFNKKINTQTNEPIFLDQKKFNKEISKTDFELSFGDLNKELKRGKVKIDRRLDLHGYSLISAHEKFKEEVRNNYNNNKRCLLVITGKGVHKKLDNKENEPLKLYYGKIKNSIVSWIKDEELKKYIFNIPRCKS